MDSIEKMRRLNELTKELKQRGFAESSFEAIQQANQIYGDDEMTHDVAHGVIRNSPQERIASGTTEPATPAPVDQPKIKQLTENIDTLTKKMNEIIAAINDLDTRLMDIKNRPQVVERVVERHIEKPAEQAREEQKQGQSEPKTAPHVDEKKADEYATNQRTGDYSTNDVAIDKMFYFGKK